jgi:hypothetical protein
MIEDRDEFRRRYESGEPVKVLAYDYGVCISAVSQMARRMGIIRRKAQRLGRGRVLPCIPAYRHHRSNRGIGGNAAGGAQHGRG